jgi:hypothetical protein
MRRMNGMKAGMKRNWGLTLWVRHQLAITSLVSSV